MATLFNAAEICDMGIEKEKKRRDFYGMVAERFSEKDMKELFTKLMKWEDTHIKKFVEIREGVKGLETTDSYPGEIVDYINALVDDKLYKEVSPGEFSKNVKDRLSAIQYGIGFEKDAILFFKEMLSYMEQVDREAIQKLIDEEKLHIVYLAQLKKKAG